MAQKYMKAFLVCLTLVVTGGCEPSDNRAEYIQSEKYGLKYRYIGTVKGFKLNHDPSYAHYLLLEGAVSDTILSQFAMDYVSKVDTVNVLYFGGKWDYNLPDKEAGAALRAVHVFGRDSSGVKLLNSFNHRGRYVPLSK